MTVTSHVGGWYGRHHTTRLRQRCFKLPTVTKNVASGFWLSGCVGRGDVLAAQEAVSRYTGTLNAYGTNRDKANGLT